MADLSTESVAATESPEGAAAPEGDDADDSVLSLVESTVRKHAPEARKRNPEAYGVDADDAPAEGDKTPAEGDEASDGTEPAKPEPISKQVAAANRKVEKANRIRAEAEEIKRETARMAETVKAQSAQLAPLVRAKQLIDAGDHDAAFELLGGDWQQAQEKKLIRGTTHGKLAEIERRQLAQEERERAFEAQQRAAREAETQQRGQQVFTEYVGANAEKYPNLSAVAASNRREFIARAEEAALALQSNGHPVTTENLGIALEGYYEATFAPILARRGQSTNPPSEQTTEPIRSAQPAAPRAQSKTLNHRASAVTTGLPRDDESEEARRAAAADLMAQLRASGGLGI